MSDGPADDSSAAPFGAAPSGAHGQPANCTRCGQRFLPHYAFCPSCRAARPTAASAVESPRPHPLTPAAPTLADPAAVGYDLRFLAAPVSATREPQPVPARGGRKLGVAIACVIALAVVSAAAGGILITHRDKSGESFADLYRDVSSGVVRIKANSCGGGEGANGTGFLIAPNLVATVAHVVNGSASLELTIGEKGAGGTTSGVVVGMDPKADVALVRLDHPVRGHVFTMASSSPRVGQEVAAIGFPEEDPMTSTRGIVSGLDRALSDPDFMRSGLIETDADVLSGYSGAPLLSADGQVIGLVDAGDEGVTYSVAATNAQPLLKSWVGKTASAVSAPCDNLAGP